MRSNVVFHLWQVNLAIVSAFGCFFVSIWANIEFGTVHTSDNILCGGVSLPISYVDHQQVDLISNSMSLLLLFRPCVVLLSVYFAFRLFSHTTLFFFCSCLPSFRCEMFTGQLRYGLSRRIYIYILFRRITWRKLSCRRCFVHIHLVRSNAFIAPRWKEFIFELFLSITEISKRCCTGLPTTTE